MIDCTLLPDIERAEKRGMKRGQKLGAKKKAIEIAQYFMGKGWKAEKIAKVTKLDLDMVESLYDEVRDTGLRYVQSLDTTQAETHGAKRGAKERAIEVAEYLVMEGCKVNEIMEATKLDLDTVKPLAANIRRCIIKTIDDILWLDVERAKKRAKKRCKKYSAERRSIEIAQYFIDKGWEAEKIAKATKLDLDTVKSLYTTTKL